jgi:threonine synthase
VTDEEILEAYRMVAALEGVFAEPASVAPIAGLRKLAQQGYFREPAIVTVTLTGHGLKDPDTAIEASRVAPVHVPPELNAVRRALEL